MEQIKVSEQQRNSLHQHFIETSERIKIENQNYVVNNEKLVAEVTRLQE